MPEVTLLVSSSHSIIQQLFIEHIISANNVLGTKSTEVNRTDIVFALVIA